MITSLEEGKSRILNAVNTNRLSHAIIITGDEYICKKLVDYAASLIFNKHEGQQLNDVSDYIRIDGASIKAADADELLSIIAVTPSSGERIIAVSNAGCMSQIIQNMLLKTVEEPPLGNHFFFYGNESGILPTICSRCAYITLGQISFEDITDILIENGAKQNDAQYFSMLSNGSVNNALKLYSDEDFLKFTYDCADYFFGIKKVCLISDKLKDFAVQNAQYAVSVFELCISDIRRCKLGIKAEYFTRAPFSQKVTVCSDILSERQINEIALLLINAKKTLNINVPARQVLDNLAAKIEQVVS